jgi:uncharacterized Zn-finger protein
MGEQKIDKPCSEQHYQVHPQDLPISCPRPEMSSWNAHPRVYLDLSNGGEVTCPYCGTRYSLVSSE